MVRYDGSRWFFATVLDDSSRTALDGVFTKVRRMARCVDGMRSAVAFNMIARRYQELEIWQLCEEIRKRVMAETAKDHVLSDRNFCDQIRDAAEDATSDVAEGFARFKPREFAQFLGYAISSLAEVRERTRHGFDRRYFSPTAAAELTRLCVRADKAAKSLRRYLWRISPEDVPYHPDARPQRRRRSRAGRRPESKT